MTDKTKKFDVLVVDNEPRICELIQFFFSLSKKINRVVTANSTLQALQKMSNQSFDIIIVDQVMPGKSGLELAEHVKKIPKYHNVKILLISGCLQKEDVIKALNLGIKHVLVKPFTHQQLFEKMENLLGLKSML
ncbi:MAG: response regulator [bacterium]